MDRHLDTILIDRQHGKAKLKYGLMDIGKNFDFFSQNMVTSGEGGWAILVYWIQ